MSVLAIDTAAAFEPLLQPSRYKGAHGGRGSGKSHFFSELLVEEHFRFPGFRSVCIREIQKDLKDSAKLLIEDKIQRMGLASYFRVLTTHIETQGNGQIIFRGMQDYNAESIKSLEGFDRAWIEEAHTLSARSLNLLRPTIRAENSELWFSWNPRRESDPVDQLLRGAERPTSTVVIETNWHHNPWFPATLEQERQDCLRINPDQYGHIWQGEYVSVIDGAYYAKPLTEAKNSGRLCPLSLDPLMTIRAYWDIGGTGAKADATAIWICQFIGTQVRVLDYYEAVGQPLAAHINWLRAKGYDNALCVLPHDGAQHDKIMETTYEGMIGVAGFATEVVPNQGKGAAAQRIEAGRRLFPSIWFDDEKCKSGLLALGWYHERKDEARSVGLGPEHDWSSHGADAFGLMCVHHEPPRAAFTPPPRNLRRYV